MPSRHPGLFSLQTVVMIPPTDTPQCPHCNEPLCPIKLPDDTGWDLPYHWVCFNDDCTYFREGWVWMEDQFGVRSSYRYRVDPASGKDSPIAVWSFAALKDRIIEPDAFAALAARIDPSTEG